MDEYLKRELLGCMGSIHTTSEDTANLFPKSFYILPPSEMCEHCARSILSPMCDISVLFILAILTDVQWYLSVVNKNFADD